MRKRIGLKSSVLRDVIRRVARVSKPEKIILFGSAARGEMGPNSDIDLLVVKSGRYHRGRLTEAIYAGLYGAGAAVDVILATPAELQQHRDSRALVIGPALREGKVVYGA